jgi:hypothetical protein
MKQIQLPKDKFTLVDDDDYEMLSKFKWNVYKYKHVSYVYRQIRVDSKIKAILMHREVMGVSDNSILVDHKDHDGFNNQKSNLRLANKIQNGYNRNKNKVANSKYKGVCWSKTNKKWMAQICVNTQRMHLGFFADEIEAAKVYDVAAMKHHGEFANINFK